MLTSLRSSVRFSLSLPLFHARVCAGVGARSGRSALRGPVRVACERARHDGVVRAAQHVRRCLSPLHLVLACLRPHLLDSSSAPLSPPLSPSFSVSLLPRFLISDVSSSLLACFRAIPFSQGVANATLRQVSNLVDMYAFTDLVRQSAQNNASYDMSVRVTERYLALVKRSRSI